MKERTKKSNMLEISIQNHSQMSQAIQKVQESANQMIPRISLINTEGINVPQVLEQSRKPLSWLLLSINILSVSLSCFQNGYYVYAPQSHADIIGYIFIGIMVFNCIVCVYTSCYLSDKWQITQLYLLLDNILLVYVAAVIGFVCFSNFRSDNSWHYDTISITFPIDFFLITGNYRVLLVKAEWSKWKIISYKAALLVCCIMFFQIGVYFITVNYSYTNGLDSTFDGQMKQLMLLNVFGTFSLIIQMYSKMTDLDHTGELQSKYELKQFNDNQLANGLIQYTQLLKIRQDAQRKNLL